MKTKILGLLAVALLAGPVAANASMMKFSLSDATDTFVFQLDSNPTPSSFGDLRTDFANTAVSINGTVTLFDVFFYTPNSRGGLALFGNDAYLLSQVGPQLFAGTTAVPIFTTGVWALSDDLFVDAYNGNYTLTVSAVPEPGTLALLGLGLAGLGMSRRRKAA